MNFEVMKATAATALRGAAILAALPVTWLRESVLRFADSLIEALEEDDGTGCICDGTDVCPCLECWLAQTSYSQTLETLSAPGPCLRDCYQPSK